MQLKTAHRYPNVGGEHYGKGSQSRGTRQRSRTANPRQRCPRSDGTVVNGYKVIVLLCAVCAANRHHRVVAHRIEDQGAVVLVGVVARRAAVVVHHGVADVIRLA